MDTVRTDKSAVRRRMRELLRAQTAAALAAASAAIVPQLLALPEIQAARTIFCYLSMPEEIDTRPLVTQLLSAGKAISAPVIAGDELELHVITSLADCTPGAYGILTPTHPRPFPGTPDVTITPGLAFTPQGARLGRGRGFYDRFFTRHPGTLPIALALDEQVLPQLPTSPDDQRVAAIVTPTRVIRCRPA